MNDPKPPWQRLLTGADAKKAAELAAVTTLRVDPGEAAEIMWATNAPELYQLLISQRGWTPERYEHFLADTWRRVLLPG